MSDQTANAGGTTPTQINVSPNPGGGGDAAPPASWTQGFNDELKGYVELKGFKDPASVVESYRNFEKLRGAPQERILTLPEKEDDPAWNDVWNKLGRPATPKDYKFNVPKENGDEKFAEWAQETMHKLNIPRKQAEALVEKWNEFAGSKLTEQRTASEAQVLKESNDLKKEWGQAYDQNVQMGRQAVKAFGFDQPTLEKLESAMGFAGLMKFAHSLQTKIGEDSFVNGNAPNNGSGKMTPGQAKARISMLKNDPDFTKRYINGEAGPRQEMQLLHEMAYSEG